MFLSVGKRKEEHSFVKGEVTWKRENIRVGSPQFVFSFLTE
jgi:hypothetical protein